MVCINTFDNLVFLFVCFVFLLFRVYFRFVFVFVLLNNYNNKLTSQRPNNPSDAFSVLGKSLPYVQPILSGVDYHQPQKIVYARGYDRV